MRIIGLDVGESRIGVAISDPDGTTAFPLTVIRRDSDAAAVRAILEIIDEQEAGAIVYGYPGNLDGSSGPQAAITEEFVDLIRAATETALFPQDERLTSAQAEKVLLAQGVKRAKRREIIDKVAAAIILQAYLDGDNGKTRA
jgi:putative Holliday junction resolvase